MISSRFYVMRILALFVVLALAGCLSPNEDWTIETAQGERNAVLHIPEGEGPFPLLIALHGGIGTPKSMMDKSQFDDLADQEGFVVAYPEGKDRTWNAGYCCGKARDNNVDDVAFLEALIDRVDVEVGVSKVGVVGHSNGAMMAYKMSESDKVDFIGVVAGAIGGQQNGFAPEVRIKPDRPIELVIIHARDDPNVPYDGGQGPQSVDPLRIDLSVQDAVDLWMQVNDASLIKQETDGEVQRSWYEGEAPILLVSTLGGHGWPGSSKNIAFTTNPPNPDASQEFVKAFLTD